MTGNWYRISGRQSGAPAGSAQVAEPSSPQVAEPSSPQVAEPSSAQVAEPSSARVPEPGLIAAAVTGGGMALLAAAAFAVSYPGLHGLSRQAGLSPAVAWILPVSLDVAAASAVLAVLALRRGRSWRTALAWICLLIVLAAAAAGSAAATGLVQIPARSLAGTVAIAPWPLLLLAVGLLLAVRRAATASSAVRGQPACS
jgi:Protein of unknown function (DUF2637)/Cornifin (SPRR) family